jgi:hypothetical protein
MPEDEIEIGDVEDYSTPQDKAFSHQVLIMTTMKKALENGAREMRAGWYQLKQDKNGNVLRTPIEDTRKTFIESVRTCEMAIESDIDDIARIELDELHNNEEDVKDYYLKLEEDEWKSLHQVTRRKLSDVGKTSIHGKFNIEKKYYQDYLEDLVDIYREIFKALTRLTKRLDFYMETMYTA